MNKLIAEYPAFKLYEMPEWKRNRIKHGDVFAIMFPSRNHGPLPHFFTFGSVFGSAVQNGDDPLEAYCRANDRGHEIRWVNANAVVLSNSPKAQVTRYVMAFGDEISFEGTRYRLDKAPNDNVKLTQIS